MTISEKAAAARALADELFKGPCNRADGKRCAEGPPTAIKVYPFGEFYAPTCPPCRAYWYAEMAAQTLERIDKVTPVESENP